MSIPFSKYVDIVSGVGAGTVLNRRDLILRLFTINPLVPTDGILEFTSASDVGEYFGTTSEEYKRAVFYFGWISKNITRAKSLSFARWVQTADAPRIYGVVKTQTLATYTAITTGSFVLTIGTDSNTINALDFSAATSLANVATIIQTKIRTFTGTQWTAATVTYDATRGSFNFVGGSAVNATISVTAAGSGTPILDLIGWGTGAILSNGSLEESVSDVLIASTETNDDFGSFIFIPALSLDQVVEAATWNQTQNVKFQYHVAVTTSNYTTYSDALIDIGGVGLTLSDISGEYPEMFPTMILAATDYDRVNSTQNYMFQIANLTPSVTSSFLSNALDLARVNYYGQTQNNGQQINFYQRGVLMGIATDPLDMNTYANEQWFKDAAGTAIMQLLLSLAKISANAQGRSQLITVVQSVVQQARLNGTISPGKDLTVEQQLYIEEITGNPLAWHQVQTDGYWLNCTIDASINTAFYTFVYSKDDVIRKVEGTHVLI